MVYLYSHYLLDHLKHLTLHGVLHLLGYDHETDEEATDMETYGISFAIPYGLANKIMQKIIADGRVIRGYIGIDGQDINSVTSRLLGNKNIGGIVVLGIDPAGPAATGRPRQQGHQYALHPEG